MARDVRSAGSTVGDDPFVTLLSWLLTMDGARAGIGKIISSDTLQDWRAGKYPRQRSTKALAAVDEWARRSYPGVYPPDWAHSGLIGLAGSELARATAASATPPSDDYQDSAPALPWDAVGARERSGRWVRVATGFSAVAIVAAGAVIAILLSSAQHPASSSTLYARGGGRLPFANARTLIAAGLTSRRAPRSR
jgi:hypothetical protein